MNSIKFKILSVLVLLTFFFSSSVAPALAAFTYLYDANGNMTSDGTKCYVYNEANQLKQVKLCSNNQIIAEYVYDYQGNRIVKKQYTAGTLQKTVYSPSDDYETVKQATNGATQNTSYYYANDQLLAKKNPDGSKLYYQNDHLGSNALLTNQSGTVVESTTYKPYGEVKTGGTLSKFQYTGQEKDQESGLNYYNSRYYDPHLQRFIQPDTWLPNVYDPQQLNRYGYANNNPIKYVDPTGHFNLFSSTLGFVTSFGTPTDQKKLLSTFTIPTSYNSLLKGALANNYTGPNQKTITNNQSGGNSVTTSNAYQISSKSNTTVAKSLPIRGTFTLSFSSPLQNPGQANQIKFGSKGYAFANAAEGSLPLVAKIAKGARGFLPEASITYSQEDLVPNSDDKDLDVQVGFMNIDPLHPKIPVQNEVNGLTSSFYPSVSFSNVHTGELIPYKGGDIDIIQLP